MPFSISSILHNASAFIAAYISVVGLSVGLYSLYDPLSYTRTIGIPISALDSPAVPFALFAGSRNISGCMGILTLLYSGQRRAAGVVILCGVIASFLDARICQTYGAEDGKALGHAVAGVISGLLGAMLVWD